MPLIVTVDLKHITVVPCSETECDVFVPSGLKTIFFSTQCDPHRIRNITVEPNTYVNIILLCRDSIHGAVTIGEKAEVWIASVQEIPILGSLTAESYSRVNIFSPTKTAITGTLTVKDEANVYIHVTPIVQQQLEKGL